MIDLSNKSITLVLISDIKLEDSFIAFNQCMNLCKFTKYKFFSSNDNIYSIDNDIEIIKINPINSLKEYSKFILYDLNKYIDTDYILIIQHDGYIVNENNWNDEFLNYDYIGALCGWGMGNGGFSLRSKKLMNCIEKYKILISDSNDRMEDYLICKTLKNIFEKNGIKYATHEIANKFSWQKETFNKTYNNQFGIHIGTNNVNNVDLYNTFIKNEYINNNPFKLQPKVSVIIPCYNHSKYLDECIKSVLNQTYKNYEVILIDDNSTDNSIEIAEKYKNNIKIIKNEINKGPAFCRNLGIKNSTGYYILPVDSDNILKPNCIESYVDEIKKYNDKYFIYCNIERFGEKNDIWKVKEYNFENLKAGNYIENCSIYTKQIWETVNGYDEENIIRGYEDWDFYIRLGYNKIYGKKLDMELYLYRTSLTSLVNRAMKNEKEIKEYMIDKYIKSNYIINKNNNKNMEYNSKEQILNKVVNNQKNIFKARSSIFSRNIKK